MEKEVLKQINIENSIINVYIKKKSVRRITLRIGKYNNQNDTFDCIISIPLSYSIDKALKFLMDHFDWYLKHTNSLLKVSIDENHKFLLGELVLTTTYNEQKEEAIKYIISRYNYYLNVFGLSPIPLKIKPLKSKWGSFNEKNNYVTLNLNLISVDKDLIDYVICHELTHVFVFDHSNKFYEYLGTKYKDYKSARKRLKKYSYFL